MKKMMAICLDDPMPSRYCKKCQVVHTSLQCPKGCGARSELGAEILTRDSLGLQPACVLLGRADCNVPKYMADHSLLPPSAVPTISASPLYHLFASGSDRAYRPWHTFIYCLSITRFIYRLSTQRASHGSLKPHHHMSDNRTARLAWPMSSRVLPQSGLLA